MEDLTLLPTTIQEAREIGSRYYYHNDGNTCPNGHDSKYIVASGSCYQCSLEKSKGGGRKGLLQKYGIDGEIYMQVFKEQDFKCAICKIELNIAYETDNRNAIGTQLDHDHKTGIFRGIFCTNCNKGLGLFFDNVDNFVAAIAYLTKPRTPYYHKNKFE